MSYILGILGRGLGPISSSTGGLALGVSPVSGLEVLAIVAGNLGGAVDIYGAPAGQAWTLLGTTSGDASVSLTLSQGGLWLFYATEAGGRVSPVFQIVVNAPAPLATPFATVLHLGVSIAEQLAGVLVNYYRGDLAAAGVVLLGRSGTDEADQAEQIHQTLEDVDLIAARTFPDFGDGWTEPLAEDLVEWADPTGTVRRHKVHPPFGTENAWRFSDANQNRLRIHTKFLECLP